MPILKRDQLPTEDKKEGWRISLMDWAYDVPTIIYPEQFYNLLPKQPALILMVQPKEEDRSSSRFYVTDNSYQNDLDNVNYYPIRGITKSRAGVNLFDTIFAGAFNSDKVGKKRVGTVRSTVDKNGNRTRSEHFDEVNKEFEEAFNSVNYEWDPTTMTYKPASNRHHLLMELVRPQAAQRPVPLIFHNREALPVHVSYKQGGIINYLNLF